MGSFAEGLIGIVLDDRYRLDAVLGEGGMGSVFRAHHLAMDRKVAVKLLKPHLTNDTNALQRFAAEARRTMRVDSPNAVKVIDAGVTAQGDYFIVLEYLDGRTVQRELEVDGPFVATRVVHIARQALHALGAAHASGLVHRDIKPDNLMLMHQGDDPDFTKVLDFGVAKLMQGAAGPNDRSALALTAQGMVFGTPEFMSPEQACGLPLDGRSDLYALAATMFAMLTGCGLYDAKSPIEWLTSHARTPPPHLADVSADLAQHAELDELIQKCLAKRAELRPKNAAEMDALLDRIERRLHGKSVTAPGRPVKMAFSGSSYIAALPPDQRIERLPTAETTPERSVTDLPIDDAPARSSRVGLFVALGGVAIAALLGVAIYKATREHGGRTSPPDGVIIAHPTPDAAPAHEIAVDAAPIDAPVDAAAPVDAPVIDAATPALRPDAGTPPVDTRAQEIAQHLAAAKQAPNALKELSEADAALKLDPGNVMARYYKGDALLKYNNPDGCQILAGIKQFPPAKKRASEGGCPE